MISKRSFHIMDIAKIGAWIVFICLSVLALVFIPVSIAACSDPRLYKAYIGIIIVCFFYLLFYFISRFLIYIYPWWSKRKKATQIITSVISIILVITIPTVSIVIPIKRRTIEFTNHFQTNWEINILDHAKLKYGQSWSYGFVGGHDELVYAVYKLNKAQSDELSLLVPNQICALKSWHRIELDRIKKDHPNLEQKKYAELYFDNVLQRFRFSVPKRFLVDWKSENTYWGLRGGIAANYNHKSTDACLFTIYDSKTARLTLFEYLVADH